jgi:hypothetical protein
VVPSLRGPIGDIYSHPVELPTQKGLPHTQCSPIKPRSGDSGSRGTVHNEYTRKRGHPVVSPIDEEVSNVQA